MQVILKQYISIYVINYNILIHCYGEYKVHSILSVQSIAKHMSIIFILKFNFLNYTLNQFIGQVTDLYQQKKYNNVSKYEMM